MTRWSRRKKSPPTLQEPPCIMPHACDRPFRRGEIHRRQRRPPARLGRAHTGSFAPTPDPVQTPASTRWFPDGVGNTKLERDKRICARYSTVQYLRTSYNNCNERKALRSGARWEVHPPCPNAKNRHECLLSIDTIGVMPGLVSHGGTISLRDRPTADSDSDSPIC